VVALACAGAGFLLAVLWFDLMFDVQALRERDPELPEETLASIAAYYARVTTSARPMSLLIAAVMGITLGALVAEVIAGDVKAGVAWASLVLAAAPVAVAATRTFPSAARLGTRSDPPAVQSELARSIGRQHVACLASIAVLLVLQLAAA
jgi:hypothetical protein